MDRRDKAQQGAMKSSGKTNSGKFGESLFMGEGASGLKVSPKSVLVMSLLFIASVVVLHFFDKLKA